MKWLDDDLKALLVVVVPLLIVFALLLLYQYATLDYGYSDIAALFQQCIADDTFTRAECVIIAGGGK